MQPPSLLFSGMTRLTGEPKNVRRATQEALKEKPLTIYTHVAPGDVILLDGQDTVHFLLNKLAMHLEPNELAYLDPTTFAEVKKDPEKMGEYLEILDNLQNIADDAEEQQSASEFEEELGWVSLSDLMERFYNIRKAAGNKAIDGTLINDKAV